MTVTTTRPNRSLSLLRQLIGVPDDVVRTEPQVRKGPRAAGLDQAVRRVRDDMSTVAVLT